MNKRISEPAENPSESFTKTSPDGRLKMVCRNIGTDENGNSVFSFKLSGTVELKLSLNGKEEEEHE